VKQHTSLVKSRIQSIPPLASKTFVLAATRDSAGNLPVAPYVVIWPADGTDSVERLAGPNAQMNPRFVLHIVGSSYDNAQTVTELVKAKFVAAGFGIQAVIPGEFSGGMRISEPQPTQVDYDLDPPLIYNTLEVAWEAQPLPV
jgi:hypothetical protein